MKRLILIALLLLSCSHSSNLTGKCEREWEAAHSNLTEFVHRVGAEEAARCADIGG